MTPGPISCLELWDGDIHSVPPTNKMRQQEVRNDSLTFRRDPEMVPLGSPWLICSMNEFQLQASERDSIEMLRRVLVDK